MKTSSLAIAAIMAYTLYKYFELAAKYDTVASENVSLKSKYVSMGVRG